MSDDRAQLDYAPRPPQRSRYWRRIVWGTIAGIIVLLATKFGPVAWRHLTVLYWQRACMEYRGDPTKIVYSGDGKTIPPQTPWPNFCAAWSPPGTNRNCVLFLHELRSSRRPGEPRLVCVSGYQLTLGPGIFRMDAEVISPGDTWSRPRLLTDGLVMQFADGSDLRICSGEPDPADPAHFTVRFEQGGKTGILDGYLGNDDQVKLERRR